MDRLRLAPSVGVVAAVGVVLALSVPFGLVEDPNAVITYYGGGAINPLIAGLFALVSVIVFAAAREERADPAISAGAALVLGGFAFVIAAVWAVTVPRGLVTQLSTAAVLEYHPIALAVITLALPASALLYARELGIL